MENSIPLIKPEPNQALGIMTDDRWEEIYKMYKGRVLANDFDINKVYSLDFF